MPSWLKNLAQKAVHAIVPAAGAAAAAAVGVFGAFIGYLLKPSRTPIAPPK